MNKEIESIRLHFGGDDEIDLETLTVSLRSTLTSLELISKNIVTEDDYCRFVVKNVEKGSFVVDIYTIAELSNTLLPYVPMIGKVFKQIIALRKFLKGEPPKKVINNHDNHECTIINAENLEIKMPIETINIYSKEENIERELAKAAKSLSLDSSRTTFSVVVDDGKSIEEVILDRDELEKVSKPIDTDLFVEGIQTFHVTETLKLTTIDFKGTKKWSFYRVCVGTISCSILDVDFLTRVKTEHLSFSNTSYLLVDLEIKYDPNKSESPKRSTKYFITKVHKIINDPNATLEDFIEFDEEKGDINDNL